jgi:hypothetical protein
MWDIFKSKHTKNCEKKDKLIEFYEIAHKNLISILKSECVNGEILYNTKFGMAAAHQMTMIKSWYCYFSSYFETPFFSEDSQQEELDSAESHKNDIMKVYIDIVEKYIPIAKEKITNNLRDFLIFACDTPKFFVVESLYFPFGESIPAYCFCDELKYNPNTNSFYGTICSSDWNVQEIKAYDYSIRKMTSDEFENEFLPKRIKKLGLKNEIEIIRYKDDMRKLFYYC